MVKKIFALLFMFGGTAYGAGGAKFINYFDLILLKAGVSDVHTRGEWIPVLAALFSLMVLAVVGLKYRAAVSRAGDDVMPEGHFSLKGLVETIFDFITNLAKDVIGADSYKPYLPLLTGIFCFIFVSNLSGLVPGLFPATDSINTNLAMGLSVFVIYNIAGAKEHGFSYIKQFLGPVLFLMPLMFVIEVVAHVARPVSLSLRLLGNIFGDHLVLSVFTSLTHFGAFFLLFFGLLVASIQSFVFTLLSSIYISMAISHDH
ncbi:MAG: ATP synthase F0 subunit A [Zetaproteobacteria bacterium]|nr:ATP synthase F0 subunit A [Pseudobdellovibrionaceae bacterium]